jgi:hypothetical protein
MRLARVILLGDDGVSEKRFTHLGGDRTHAFLVLRVER